MANGELQLAFIGFTIAGWRDRHNVKEVDGFTILWCFGYIRIRKNTHRIRLLSLQTEKRRRHHKKLSFVPSDASTEGFNKIWRIIFIFNVCADFSRAFFIKMTG